MTGNERTYREMYEELSSDEQAKHKHPDEILKLLVEPVRSSVYAVVSIGNTDNKLTQQQWSVFVTQINDVLKHYGKIHFFGGAPNWEPWQNVAWIVECSYATDVSNFSVALEVIRKKNEQDSIFILQGLAKFI